MLKNIDDISVKCFKIFYFFFRQVEGEIGINPDATLSLVIDNYHFRFDIEKSELIEEPFKSDKSFLDVHDNIF